MFETHKHRRGHMQSFTAKYSDKIQGVLSGFDRLIFRGSLRKIACTFGLNSYLWANHVLLKDFGSHANEISERVKTAALRCVQESGRRIQYLQSSKDNKEEIAQSIARHDHLTEGPVCEAYRSARLWLPLVFLIVAPANTGEVIPKWPRKLRTWS